MTNRMDNTFKVVSSKIASCESKEALIAYYGEFIANYKELDAKYHFSEYMDEGYIYDQLEHHLALAKRNSPFFAVPFGIKDIFNTRVLPTAMGSEIWEGFKAGNNSRIVDEIYDLGGVIFSKTTTAEFAVHFISPSKTLNPHNPKHITGTSSAGSAVAVACGALPVALGTQTAASIMRPASFCGVYGFKPSFGAIDRTGVLKTNDTLDTIGLLGSDIDGLKKVFYEVMQKGIDYPLSANYFNSYTAFSTRSTKEIKIGILAEAFGQYGNYADYVKKSFSDFVEVISKSYNVKEIQNVDYINSIHKLHENIYSKSLSYYFQNEIRHYDSVSEIMTEMINRGEKISTEDYVEAIKLQPLLRNQFNEVFQDFDFIITPSTASAAPPLNETELDDTSLIWTFFGYPTISIPMFFNSDLNLPYGLQVVAKKFDDFALLDFAQGIEGDYT